MRERVAEPALPIEFTSVFHDPVLNLRFARDGFVVVDFLDRTAVDELLDVWKRNPDPVRAAYTSTAFSPDLSFRDEMSAAIESIFEKPVRELLSDYRSCLAGFIRKRPGQQSGLVALHQDPSIVDESRFVSINIWCPLVDVNPRNGCLRVVPGSHLINRGSRAQHEIDFPYAELLQLIESNLVVEISMRAGQAFAYTQALFHGSSPNLSDEERLVAGCMTIPSGSQLLIFARGRDRQPHKLAAYAVTDDYYRHYCLGSEPDQHFFRGFVDDAPESLDEPKLMKLMRSVNARRSS